MYLYVYVYMYLYMHGGSKTALAQVAKLTELPCMARLGMEFAKGCTLTADELTNTTTVVIAMITVCATLSVVAGIYAAAC